MLMSKKHRSSSGGVNLGTGQRSRKKSKKFNTESEEYDSLNSDSDTVSRELDATSRTESSNCLDEQGPVNFSSKFEKLETLVIRKVLKKFYDKSSSGWKNQFKSNIFIQAV